MILSKDLTVFVISRDGMNQMTLGALMTAFVVGTRFDDVTITTDEVEAKRLDIKRMAIQRLVELGQNMTAEQVVHAVTTLQKQDDLMETHEDPTTVHVPLPQV